MEVVFLKLLNMSITASWLVLAVIVIRLLLKKAPKFIRCIMWAMVGIRLICPFSLESSLSLVPSAQTVPQEIIYAQTPSIESGVSVLNQAVNPVISEVLSPEVGASVNPIQVVLFAASVIWIAGMLVMLVYTLISYLRIHRKVREAIELKDKVWICDHIDTPFIFGVFRPRIFLPSSMNEADMEYVIAHERAHLARHDHLWKPLGFLLLTIYWFNPLMWIAYILLCRDIEMACDEKVIKDMGLLSKKSYSEALINCSVSRKVIAACPLAFGEVSVKNRIKSVLNYKKPAFWLVIVAAVSCVVVAVCFLTNPSGMKLTELKEDISFEKLFDDVERLEVVSGEESYATEEEETIEDIVSILQEVKISRKPVSQSRAEDRDRTNCITINDGDTLCFSKDYSVYWVYTGVKPTFSYKVLNPETAKKAFEIEKLSSYSDSSAVSDYYFDAVVLETGTTILVEPFEDSQERKSADKIYVSTNVSAEQSVPTLEAGDAIRIYYDGQIMETYPAQISNVYAIYLLEDIDEPYHIEVIDVTYLSDSSSILENPLNNDKMFFGEGRHLPVYKFENKDELENFIKKYIGNNDKNAFYKEAAKKYNESFFESKSLILAYIWAGSSAYDYGVKSIYDDGQNFIIHAEQINCLNGEGVTEDMAEWFVTVAVDKELIQSCTVFDADLEEP